MFFFLSSAIHLLMMITISSIVSIKPGEHSEYCGVGVSMRA